MSPHLAHLIILNPSITQASPEQRASDPIFDGADPDDHGELSQLLFHWSREGSKREDALRQMGLAKGLIGFLDMTTRQADQGEDVYRMIHTVERTTAIWRPERNFLILAVVHNKDTTTTSSSAKAKSIEPRPTITTIEVDAVIKLDLRLAYERYRLLNNTLTNLLTLHGPTSCRAKLEPYWLAWSSGYVPRARGLAEVLDVLPQREVDLERSEAWTGIRARLRTNASLITLHDDQFASATSGPQLPSSTISIILHHLQDCLDESLPRTSSRRKGDKPTAIEPRGRQTSSSSGGGAGTGLWARSLGFDMWPRSADKVPPRSDSNEAGSSIENGHRRADPASTDPTPGPEETSTISKWHVPGVSLGLGGVGGLFGFGGGSRVSSRTDTAEVPEEHSTAASSEDRRGSKSEEPVEALRPPLPDEPETGIEPTIADGLELALSEAQVASLPELPLAKSERMSEEEPPSTISSTLVWLPPYEVPGVMVHAIDNGAVVALVHMGDTALDTPEESGEAIEKSLRTNLDAAVVALRAYREHSLTNPRPARPGGATVSWLSTGGAAHLTARRGSAGLASAESAGLWHWFEQSRDRLPGLVEVLGRTTGNKWMVSSRTADGVTMYLQVDKAEATMVDANFELRKLIKARDSPQHKIESEIKQIQHRVM